MGTKAVLAMEKWKSLIADQLTWLPLHWPTGSHCSGAAKEMVSQGLGSEELHRGLKNAVTTKAKQRGRQGVRGVICSRGLRYC